MRTIDAEALKKAIDDYAEKRQDTLLWQADIEEIIDNAPTRSPYYKRPKGECEKCDYYSFSQAFINGIVEIISKYGITTVDELLEILKGGDGHE